MKRWYRGVHHLDSVVSGLVGGAAIGAVLKCIMASGLKSTEAPVIDPNKRYDPPELIDLAQRLSLCFVFV